MPDSALVNVAVAALLVSVPLPVSDATVCATPTISNVPDAPMDNEVVLGNAFAIPDIILPPVMVVVFAAALLPAILIVRLPLPGLRE